MLRYIVRRLLIMIPLLLGVSFLTFAMMNLIPGSPLQSIERNPDVRPADVARMKEQFGLNDPWPQRYVEWLGDALRGDFGPSFYNRLPVTDRIWSVMPNTLLLTSSALILALGISVPLGVYSAVYHKRLFDRIVNIVAVALYSIPGAWLGLLLIIVLSVKATEWNFGWLPPFPPGSLTDARGGGGLGDRIHHLILPAFTLATFQIGVWTAYIRSSMLEALGQDYVRTARSKGLRESFVLYRHAFRNALLTLVTLVGLSIPGLFGGAILIEAVFNWPGMGLLTLEAVSRRDYTMVQATTILFAVLTMFGNLIADLLYGFIDPRVRAR
jgi:peptide/nickel transport system permease protein